MDWFSIASPFEKLRKLPDAVSEGLRRSSPSQKEFHLGRDVRVVSPAELPVKPGLSSAIGQARLLHDLASIELQAMELAMRTLYEFPEAPGDFRHELAEIALSEGKHLALCLDSLQNLGHAWGDWDVHLSLWNVVAEDDSLLDRILIVHRYLEGSGLDAGESILRRLGGVASKAVRQVVLTIVDEEVDHVLFGSRWYRSLAKVSGVDPDQDFARRIARVAALAPRREKLARDLRRRAGFTEAELDILGHHIPV